MTAITDHNYNWRLHRRVWLAWPGPGSQLRTEDESGLSGVREGRGACSVCQLPIHHGDTGANMEHGVMLINIYPQCSHYYEQTRWIVLVLINMGHIGLTLLRFEYNPVFEWVSESIHHIAQHSDQAWRGKRGSRGWLSVSDGVMASFLPHIPHTRLTATQAEEERKLIFEILFQFITSRLHTNQICRLFFSHSLILE